MSLKRNACIYNLRLGLLYIYCFLFGNDYSVGDVINMVVSGVITMIVSGVITMIVVGIITMIIAAADVMPHGQRQPQRRLQA